jgi:hypothetical protein
MAIDCVFTNVFIRDNGFSQHDSTAQAQKTVNHFDLFRGWYESVKRLGLFGIILHDDLPCSLIDKLHTERISFVSISEHKRLSYNDSRFFAILDFLQSHTQQFRKIVFTDAFDVLILKDPFAFMSDTYDLYLGHEGKSTHGSAARKWTNKKLVACGFKELQSNEILYNAGISGGLLQHVIPFYQRITTILSTAPIKQNLNMGAFNQAVRDMLQKNVKIYTGHPLHNLFGSEKITPDTIIKHK